MLYINRYLRKFTIDGFRGSNKSGAVKVAVEYSFLTMEVRNFVLFVLVIVVKIERTLQTFRQNSDTDFFYYPSQDGSDTLIQAFLHSPNATNHPAIKEANPADIHFYLYTP